MRPVIRKAAAVAASILTLTAMTACSQDAGADGGDGDTVTFGVSGPLTGDQAQYGKDWQAGFDLALDELNAEGDITYAIDFQDSQGQAAQATNIAQKFVSDDKISAVMGDFSSATSMVASPVYQRAGLLQLGITNSHPDFTTTGDFIFSPSITQDTEGRVMADGAKKLGDKAAVFYLNTDWGKAAFDVFSDQSKTNGLDIVYSSSVEETSTDFKPLLLRAKESGADVIQFLTYYKTTALLVQQATDVGLTDVALSAVGSNYSSEFLELAGDAAEGVYVETSFYPGSDNADVRKFVDGFQAKYDRQPNVFSAYAYDGLKELAWASENSDGSREGIRNALRDGTEVPTIIYGPAQYNDERRIENPTFTWLVVKDGTFVAQDPTRS
ncbi:ABC transporter substrate-binding protein [Tessaracoccus antarcticus]|uniref:ABC transporter substrate-binding protein n=1 Tax=Tessaracoccus antarcticus TaxID=2479848 RepID=A0A3M0G9B8_9ACTN|nr:ABC transporter substrate-binding protein [Tessaracoccus antarcticus]RMB61600.1 ABC transporter substrate-binding protein [Tessaracoccus antarcticus]